jgi:cytochrome bd-type quinol oxidase subunit 2
VLGQRLWLAVLALTALATCASAAVQPRLLENLSRYPLGLVCPLLAFGGLAGARFYLSRDAKRAFTASSLCIAGLVLSAALAIFPHALPARIAGRELSLAAASAHPETLQSMLYWWLPGVLIAATYSALIYRHLPERFRIDEPH